MHDLYLEMQFEWPWRREGPNGLWFSFSFISLRASSFSVAVARVIRHQRPDLWRRQRQRRRGRLRYLLWHDSLLLLLLFWNIKAYTYKYLWKDGSFFLLLLFLSMEKYFFIATQKERDDETIPKKGEMGALLCGGLPPFLSLHSLYFYFIPKKFPLLIILFPTTFIFFFFKSSYLLKRIPHCKTYTHKVSACIMQLRYRIFIYKNKFFFLYCPRKSSLARRKWNCMWSSTLNGIVSMCIRVDIVYTTEFMSVCM